MLFLGAILIEQCKEPFSKEDSLESLNVFVRKWFEGKYGGPTPPQRYSFKLIKENRSMLITAPTGSGKTFSAFMGILSGLMNMSMEGKLEEKVYCIYVSPLRALNNDVYKNLIGPLEEIYSGIGIDIRRITVGIRTGDTTQKERQRQVMHPPNILVTTPESLAIMLNSPRFVKSFSEVKYVVIDELHELANNKRGVHLSLSLERLADIAGLDFVRIGLGATLYPLDEAARFLVGYKGALERDCSIVDATWDKKMQFIVKSPVKDIINASDASIEKSIYAMIDKIIKTNKTTLVFTNTRSGTERVVYNLSKRFGYGEDSIAAHHGSLSREIRLGVEDMLKKGSLRCAVSSTSLELGIDIGTIDNVVQIGSPKSVSRAVQRIGRSGHSFMDVAKGEVVVTNRDDLIECAVMLDAAKKRHLDAFSTPKNALDVLAQHILGMAISREWKVSEAYNLVRQSYPYHDLSLSDFKSLLDYLSGKYVGLESRRVYGKIWYDSEKEIFRSRGGAARPIYYLNIGTIPDEVAIDVMTKDEKWIGSIQEEFMARLKPGDVFVLAGKPIMFEFSRGMKCFVTDARGMAPTIPPWISEQLPLTYDLAIEIGRFRRSMASAVKGSMGATSKAATALVKGKMKASKAAKEILDQMPIDYNSKESIVRYFAEQLLIAGHVPNDKSMLIEITEDDKEERQLAIFHSLYGRRVNDALSRIFAILIGDIKREDIGMNISDNGFILFTGEGSKIRKSEIEKAINMLNSIDADSLLRENIARTELMKRRFRHCAARSLMILRNYMGRKMSVRRQQVSAQLLLKASAELGNDFPVIKETYREILQDMMDLPTAKKVIGSMLSGDTSYIIIETKIPSPFSHNLITFGEADVIIMKDRRKRIRELHKQVLSKIRGMAYAHK